MARLTTTRDCFIGNQFQKAGATFDVTTAPSPLPSWLTAASGNVGPPATPRYSLPSSAINEAYQTAAEFAAGVRDLEDPTVPARANNTRLRDQSAAQEANPNFLRR